MMKGKFQFYKNIILVVASALTLVAVTFAWFSDFSMNNVGTISNRVGTDLIYVDFNEMGSDGNYTTLSGDIDLSGIVSGEYKQYKFIIRTNTQDPMKLNFAIDGLQSEINQQLKDAVNIKYTLMTANRTVKNNVVTYTDGTVIDTSADYMSLSELSSDQVSSVSLKNYQTSDNNYFIMYYEIGLPADADNSVQGLSGSLGTVRLSAQLIG